MKRTVCLLSTLAVILFLFSFLHIPVSAAYDGLDYGPYSSEVTNEFVQVSSITLGKSYILAIVDKQAFDSFPTVHAAILTNYGNYKLALVPGELTRDQGSDYHLSSTPVDGMVWNAITYDVYYNVERYALFNNDAYLNVDGDTSLLHLDTDGYRTRWKSIMLSSDYPSLEYAIGSSLYYISDNGLSMQSSTIVPETLPVTDNIDESLILILLEAQPVNQAETPLIPIAVATIPEDSSTTRQQSPAYTENTEQMVWLSATGDSYHSRNNCGRMNPAKARQVTISEAIALGKSRCSKCW